MPKWPQHSAGHLSAMSLCLFNVCGLIIFRQCLWYIFYHCLQPFAANLRGAKGGLWGRHKKAGAKITKSSLRFNKQCYSVLLTNRSPMKGAASGRNGSRDSCLPATEEFQECTVTSRWCNLAVGKLSVQVLSCLADLWVTQPASIE